MKIATNLKQSVHKIRNMIYRSGCEMIKDNSEENALLQREVFKKEKRAIIFFLFVNIKNICRMSIYNKRSIIMRIFLNIIIIIGFIVVTLFGLGPVLLADGTRTERFFTLLVVISLYFLLTLALKWVKKRYS